MKINFYDTSSLLLKDPKVLQEEYFMISSITLAELENIKNSKNKSEDIKLAARQIVHTLPQCRGCDVVIFKENMLKPIEKQSLVINDDMRILASAIWAHEENENLIFVTNDLCLKLIAQLFLNNIDTVKIKDNSYKGYKEVSLTIEEMAKLYSNPKENNYNILNNEYLIVRSIDTNEITDILRYSKDGFKPLKQKSFDSLHIGKISAFKDDIYQKMAMDSLMENKISVLRGPAGSGKSLISMSYLFNQLEKGKIDRIVIFCNPVCVRGAAKLGYYPGDRLEKLLDSQIGNFLSGKLGGIDVINQLIQEEKLILLPMSDIRGYQTPEHSGVYITEAQNMSIDLMKLMLQRIDESSIVIVEGDNKAQLDMAEYEGINNGMNRLSEVFRGQDFYGEVELQQIHRSKIAELAEQM